MVTLGWAGSATAQDSKVQAAAAPAQQAIGSQPASTAEILDAVGACNDAVKAHGEIDMPKLAAAGWQTGGRRAVPAKPPMPATTEFIFGKGNVILVISDTGLTASCKPVARVSSDAQEGEVRQGIMSRFGAKRFKDYPGDAAFKASMERMMKPDQLDAILISDTNRFVVHVAQSGDARFLTVIMTPKILDQ
jgi:hypothetical protein